MPTASPRDRRTSRLLTSGSDDDDGEHDNDTNPFEQNIAEHSFSLDGLRRLKVLFDKYEDAGGMELEEFIEELSPELPHVSKLDLEILFKRVDANANGSVDWDEISTYLLMNDVKSSIEFQLDANARVYVDEPNQGMDRTQHAAQRHVLHRGDVFRLVMHPRHQRYYTAATDGMVKMWSSESMKHERTFHMSSAQVTEMRHLAWNDIVAVGTMDRSVCWYHSESGEMIRAFSGQRKQMIRAPNGEYVPDDRRVCIEHKKFAVPLSRKDTEDLRQGGREELFGRVGTVVPILSHFEKPVTVETTVLENLGFVKEGRRWKAIGYPTAIDVVNLKGSDKMLVGLSSGHLQMYSASMPSPFGNPLTLPCMSSMHVHWDRISRLIAVPTMDLMLTASWDGTLQVRNTDRIEDVGTVLGEGAIDPPSDYTNVTSEGYFALFDTLQRGHSRRITGMDWNPGYKMIATCAPERDVLLWSPYIQKPITKLEGNKGRVIDLHFNPADNQLVTLSDEKTIRIWDLRTYQCLHNLTDPFTDGTRKLLSANIDSRKGSVVLATSLVRSWPLLHNTEFHASYGGHRRPVVASAYSYTFNQLITADIKTICVWDVKTYRVVMKWDVETPINDVCLDTKERRLLVGTQKGEIHVFNYVNGYNLKTCQPPKGIGEANAVSFGAQTRPRNAFVMVSTHDLTHESCIYVDEDGGEDAPQRVVSTGEIPLCSVVVGPSWVVFGIKGGISSHNLEEVGSRAIPFRLRSLALVPMVAVFEGPLMHDWQAIQRSGADRDAALFATDGKDEAGVAVEQDSVDGDVSARNRKVRMDKRNLEADQSAAYATTEALAAITVAPRTVIISATGDGMVQFWDLREQTELFRFRGATVPNDGIYHMKLTPDENTLIFADYAGYIKVSDISRVINEGIMTSHCSILSEMIHVKAVFRAHEGPVTSLTIMNDINMIATSANDCSVALWDMATGAPVHQLGEDANDRGAIMKRGTVRHSTQALKIIEERRAMCIVDYVALHEEGIRWAQLLSHFEGFASSSTMNSPTKKGLAHDSRILSATSFMSGDESPGVKMMDSDSYDGSAIQVNDAPLDDSDELLFRLSTFNSDDSNIELMLRRVVALLVDPPEGEEPRLFFDEDSARYHALGRAQTANTLTSPSRVLASSKYGNINVTESSPLSTTMASVKLERRTPNASPGRSQHGLPVEILSGHSLTGGSTSHRLSRQGFNRMGTASQLDMQSLISGRSASVGEESVVELERPPIYTTLLRTGVQQAGTGKTTGLVRTELEDRPKTRDQHKERLERAGTASRYANLGVSVNEEEPASPLSPMSPVHDSNGKKQPAMKIKALPSQLTGARTTVPAEKRRGQIVTEVKMPTEGAELLMRNETPDMTVEERAQEREAQLRKKRDAVAAVMRWPPVPQELQDDVLATVKANRAALLAEENYDHALRCSVYDVGGSFDHAQFCTPSATSPTPGPGSVQETAPSMDASESNLSQSPTRDQDRLIDTGTLERAPSETHTSAPATARGFRPVPLAKLQQEMSGEAPQTARNIPPTPSSVSSGGGRDVKSPLLHTPSSTKKSTARKKQRPGNIANPQLVNPFCTPTIPLVDALFEEASAVRSEQLKAMAAGKKPEWSSENIIPKSMLSKADGGTESTNRRGGYILVGDEEQENMRKKKSLASLTPKPPSTAKERVRQAVFRGDVTGSPVRLGSPRESDAVPGDIKSLSDLLDAKLSAKHLAKLKGRLSPGRRRNTSRSGSRDNSVSPGRRSVPSLAPLSLNPSTQASPEKLPQGQKNVNMGSSATLASTNAQSSRSLPSSHGDGSMRQQQVSDPDDDRDEEVEESEDDEQVVVVNGKRLALIPPREYGQAVKNYQQKPQRPIAHWVRRIHSEIEVDRTLGRLDKPLHQDVLRKHREAMLNLRSDAEGSWIRSLSTARGIKSEWYKTEPQPPRTGKYAQPKKSVTTLTRTHSNVGSTRSAGSD